MIKCACRGKLKSLDFPSTQRTNKPKFESIITQHMRLLRFDTGFVYTDTGWCASKHCEITALNVSLVRFTRFLVVNY